MRKSTITTALALVLLSPMIAKAQEFVGMEDIRTDLSGIRDHEHHLRDISPFPLEGVMGASRFLEPPFSASAQPEASSYTVRGVDISHYQGKIDWDLVKRSGLSFVYIKATEGALGVDHMFASNWAGARRAGLTRGAYHFYNFCRSGSEQAARFVKTVPRDSASLPMTIDLEVSGDCHSMPQKAAFRRSLAVFTGKIRAVYGHTPILYMDPKIYDRYFSGEPKHYKIWIVDTRHRSPEISEEAPWTIWQYDWHGRIPGIRGEVDLDVFNGTPEALAALIKKALLNLR